jgi:nucleotide-binding universal stress UspA family protein
MTSKKIVVGYDGSTGARHAARWALDEAARTGAPVEFCYADERRPPIPPTADHADEAIEDMIEDVAAAAAVSSPELEVSTVIKRGMAAADVLADRSLDAELLVLGSRGHRAPGTALDALAVEVAARARCSVVVLRGRPDQRDPVVVGVDDSNGGRLALAFAFRYADAHGLSLRIVHAWLPRAVHRREPARDLVTASDLRSLTELVDHWNGRYPAVKATEEIVVDDPANALAEASIWAQLVVVGTRGPGAFRGPRRGSVSARLLHQSESPVAVIRGVDDTP